MSTKRSGGSAKNLRDSQPKFLGVKRSDGQKVKTGEVLVRQRGTRIMAGKNVKVGKDHTLYSLIDGIVAFSTKSKIRFDGRKLPKKTVEVKGA